MIMTQFGLKSTKAPFGHHLGPLNLSSWDEQRGSDTSSTQHEGHQPNNKSAVRSCADLELKATAQTWVKRPFACGVSVTWRSREIPKEEKITLKTSCWEIAEGPKSADKPRRVVLQENSLVAKCSTQALTRAYRIPPKFWGQINAHLPSEIRNPAGNKPSWVTSQHPVGPQ